MQYVSTVTLLDNLTPGQADKKSFALAKKKMLAELELNGGAAVTINGREFTKNDIVNFFDNLQQADNLAYHIIVANDAVLLCFLEQNFLNNGDRFSNNESYADPGFIDWISPYFFTSFTSFAEECLVGEEVVERLHSTDPLFVKYSATTTWQKNDDGWATLLANAIIMNSYYLEEAWKKIEDIVRQQLEYLKEFHQAKGLVGKNLIEPLIDFRYVTMLQRLPAERFRYLRDEYAYMMMQCAVHIFNTVNRYDAETIIDNALQLVVSYDVKESILAKQSEMHHLVNKKPAGRGGGSWGLRGVGFLLFMIFKIATCNSYSGHSDYNFENAPVIFSSPYDTTAHSQTPQLDSLIYQVQQGRTFDTIPATLPAAQPSKQSPALDSILRKLRQQNSKSP